MGVAAPLIGALVGGAKAGAIFGIPSGFAVGAGTTLAGAAIGAGVGSAAGRMMKPPGVKGGTLTQDLSTPPPGPTSMRVQEAGQAERLRRTRRKGYGSTLIATPGELGTASTYRKQILG